MVHLEELAGAAGEFPSTRVSGLMLQSSTMLKRLLKSSTLILEHTFHHPTSAEQHTYGEHTLPFSPELPVLGSFHLQPFFLLPADVLPLLPPADPHKSSNFCFFFSICDTRRTLTCRSTAHGIQRIPRDSSASAAKSPRRICESETRRCQTNVRIQMVSFLTTYCDILAVKLHLI